MKKDEKTKKEAKKIHSDFLTIKLFQNVASRLPILKQQIFCSAFEPKFCLGWAFANVHFKTCIYENQTEISKFIFVDAVSHKIFLDIGLKSFKSSFSQIAIFFSVSVFIHENWWYSTTLYEKIKKLWLEINAFC